MTAEEIRNFDLLSAHSQSLMLREIAAQLAEQNELMRADQEFRRAVANEQREESKKRDALLATSSIAIEGLRKSYEAPPELIPVFRAPAEPSETPQHLGCFVLMPDGSYGMAVERAGPGIVEWQFRANRAPASSRWTRKRPSDFSRRSPDRPRGEATVIEFQSRAYLYNFDFLRFRGCAEESMRAVNTFLCQGICWKFRFGGELRVFVNGKLLSAAGSRQDRERLHAAGPVQGKYRG